MAGPSTRVWLWLPAAGLLLVGAAQIQWGERIPLGEGAGWDGKEYAAIARDLPGSVLGQGLDRYRLRRIAPSALVYATLHVRPGEPTPRRIAATFAWCNLAFLLAAAAAWAGIARVVGLGARGHALGFVLIFANLANLKMPFYYPVLTDTAALALGALLVFFHVTDRAWAMWLVLLAAAFTWPSLALFGAPLLVLPWQPLPPGPAPSRTRRTLATGLALAYGALLLARPAELRGLAPALLVLGAAVAAGWVYVIGHDLVAPAVLADPPRPGRLRGQRLAVLLVTAAAVEVAVRTLGRPTPYDTGYLLGRLSRFSVALPGLFLVAHCVYFGLAWPALAALWPRVRATLSRLGLGLVLFVAAHLLWGLHPESRTLIDGLPALALLIALAAQGLRVGDGMLLGLALLALAASKVWLPINRGFPHLYFMNYGPFMTVGDYLVQGLVAVAITVLLVWIVRRAEREAGYNGTSPS